jgi:hypothetical protein
VRGLRGSPLVNMFCLVRQHASSSFLNQLFWYCREPLSITSILAQARPVQREIACVDHVDFLLFLWFEHASMHVNITWMYHALFFERQTKDLFLYCSQCSVSCSIYKQEKKRGRGYTTKVHSNSIHIKVD